MNSAIKRSVYNPETSQVLEEAKIALISWAVNHPANPGTLPMPDRNSDGDYNGDSDCYNGGPIGNNLLLGRLPWRDYPSPCKDSSLLSGLSVHPGITSDVGADMSGRVLWYAAAHNLVYETPEYPFISPAIINNPEGWITVRDASGAVISDRVAFVVIAPGPALSSYTSCGGSSYSGQDRSGPAPDIDNYLDSVSIVSVTYSNADYDQDFIMYPNSLVTNSDNDLEQCDQFNDQLIFVTADELLDAVSKRVLNETANILSTYHNTNAALPWLVPFADPKAEPKFLTGTATSSSNDLTDTSTNFTEWGVTVGDPVWNLTDGSRATVTAVAANTLTLGSLRFGTNNTFAVGDEYYVEVRYMANSLLQVATYGSEDKTLVDSDRNFEILGVLPGDVIENLDDGSSGIVASVDGSVISVVNLVGGTDNQFASGDNYLIRTNTSKVTTTTSPASLTLIDANADFIAMGVQIGDIVYNLWDSATGRVSSIASATQLTTDELALGTGVVFNSGEPYRISRYKGRANTRAGLLPIHQMGEILPSGFKIDWSLIGGTIVTSLANDGTYTTALSGYAGSSLGYSGTITVPETDAVCQWLTEEFVRCKGLYENTAFLSGTAGAGTTATKIVDSTKNFSTLGIKRGDLLLDPSNNTGIISSLTGTNTINGVNITNTPSLSLSSGNSYRIKTATATRSGSASAPSTPYSLVTKVFTVTVPSAAGIQIGDTIENTHATWGGGIGKIVGISGNLITASELIGGVEKDIFPGEPFIIHFNFADRRQYQFDVTMKGTAAQTTSAGIPTRAVCTGYNSTCTIASNNASIKGDGTTAWVTIRDYEGATQVGQATNTITTGGLVSRSLRVAGLQYSMDANSGDVPEWFVRNKWYQYVMVAYNNGDAPGGTTCIAGTNCLTINLKASPSSPTISNRNNIRAVVMLAGNQLIGQTWTAANVSNYFDEPENTDADDLFDRFPASGSFNDLLRVAISCPTDITKLCWSN